MIKRIVLTIMLLPLVADIYGQQIKYNEPGAGNPIIPGYFADPTVRKFGDTYYIYATTDGTAGGIGPSQVWKSKDFVNWFIEPMNWPTTPQIWAPDIMQGTDGRYYFYYSQACKIYCAVSDSPTGPWTNILGADEAVLIPDRYVKMSITLDAQSFIDDDGSTYLHWGTWGIYPDHGCGVGKLNPDMKSFADTTLIPNTQAIDFFEAPYVFKRDGIYYLTYSSGSCHDHTYRVQYAISKTGPMGPFEFPANNPILETNADGTIHGPGHHSILQEGDDWFIVYHRHNIPHSTRGFHRQVAVDRLTFDENGLINKIEGTHEGVGFLAPDSNPFENIAFTKPVKASSFYNDNFRPEYAVDNNYATMWRAADCRGPQSLEIDLGQVKKVSRIWTRFEYATSFYQYIYEISRDGLQWEVFSDRRNNVHAGSPMIDRGDAEAHYVRLTVTGNEKNGLFPTVWNIEIFSDGDDPFPQNTAPFNGQAVTAASGPYGLLFGIDACEYDAGDILGRIAVSGDNTKGFNAVGMAVTVQEHAGSRAFVFDGQQDFRSDFSLPETIAGNAPYTLEARISSDDPAEHACFFDVNRAWGELERITLGWGTDPRGGIIMHNGWYEDMGLRELPDASGWVHLAVTFDGYMEKIYIDGQLVREKVIMLRVAPAKTLTLGTNGQHAFSGKIGSLRIFDRPLSDREIYENYTSSK